MIYITGDTHIPIDIGKLTADNFPEQKLMTKDDYVIICGDFGGVWDGSKRDDYWLDWLEEKNFTTLFVDGNHENFSLLNQYEEKEWNGGKVHFVRDSVIHLMRGQVYNIHGYKFFTMGGATSIDKQFRTIGKSWWPEEQPDDIEYTVAVMNLHDHSWEVDFVVTHTTSSLKMIHMNYIKEHTKLNEFFDMLEKDLKYKHWYFGHFHDDIQFSDKKTTLLYEKVIQIA